MRGVQRALALAAAALILGAASCQILAGVPKLDEPGTGGGSPAPCIDDAECDDGDPCTTDTCGAGQTCVFTPIESGAAPAKDQNSGDCQRVICAGGVAATAPDPKDVPDDQEDCTLDDCDANGPSHTAKPDLTMCTTPLGDAGRCQKGVCLVDCTPDVPCAVPSPCVTATCDLTIGACVTAPLPDGMPTPGANDPPGDCQAHVCMGGADTQVADDSDVPTGGECEIPGCTMGVPTPTPKGVHTSCSAGYCDGAGNCVECTEDGDCPGVINDCQHPVCNLTTHKCETALAPAGTLTVSNPAQVAGDCQTIACDASGNPVAGFDAADALSDGNECTLDTCMMGTPPVTLHPNAPDITTKCGVGGTLSCVGGVCKGCTMSSQCAPASCNGNVLTFAQTCNAGAGSCVSPSPATKSCAPYLCNATAGACTTTCSTDADCAAGNYCTGTGGTCKPKVPVGQVCAANHECSNNTCVDGFCCNTTCTGACFACSNAKTGAANGTCAPTKVGTDPDNDCTDQGAASCGNNGACDGAGACQKYSNTTQCAPSSCQGGTLTLAKLCNGTGTCVTPTPATTNCAPGTCGGAPAACNNTCANDSNCATTAFCSGGMCQNKKTAGQLCPTGNHECNSTFCVDGVCCSSACNTACQACTAAKKNAGSDGVCGTAKNGVADPRGICMTTAASTCGTDGLCSAGACEKWPSGTACAGVSCTAATLTAASTCDGFGSCANGGGSNACPNHLVCASATSCLTACGTSDANCTPSGAYYCAGAGAGACQAKKPDGTACGGNHECTSNVCGGNCCSTACSTGGACGSTGCDSTGACVYPAVGTSCAVCNLTTNVLSSGFCNGTGTCSGAFPSACPFNLKCQDATQCWADCLTGGNPDNTKCAGGTTCNAATGRCQ